MPKKIDTPNEIVKVEETQIEIAPARVVSFGVLDMFDRLAPVLARSRMMGVVRTEEAYAIMLKGYEVGLSITASFEFVKVILGKPELIPRGALALLHNSPLIKEIIINRLTDKEKFVGYECTMTRTSGFTYTAKFTMEMAHKAGLVKADSGWEKYEENMCLWRAVGFAADVVASDVTAGMTTLMKAPEMFGVNLTEGGDVIDATAHTVNTLTMNDLLARWTPDQILAANDGKIPSTTEEIDAVMMKLSEVK